MTDRAPGDVPGDRPDTTVPLALLPVHLETCFVPHDDGGTVDLLIRIYPDQLHVDGHEPGLTDEEHRWGRHFWEQMWAAGTGTEEASQLEVAAWAQLVQRLGTRRGAWAAQALEPRNIADRPDDPGAVDPAPRFPDAPRRSDTWTRAARARLLPDRWVVVGYRDGRRVLVEWGQPVAADLHVSPDPGAEAPDDDAPVDDGLRWLVDFDEAERVGMGLRVRLDRDEADRGYELLVTFGVRGSRDPGATAEDLAALLGAHHHTDGLSFLRQGTPVHNTPGAPAGYRSTEPDPAVSWRVERGRLGVASGDGSDADRAAAALGIAPDVLATVADADAHEHDHVRDLHTVLWPATWGYYLQQMVGTVDDATVARIRRTFVDHVRARGPLPALRIGRQPYGVLPVTALDRWTPRPSSGGEDDAHADVAGFVRALRDRWREAVAHVPRVDRRADGAAAHSRLVHALGMTPVSHSYAVRPVLDVDHADALLGRDGRHGMGGLAHAPEAASEALASLTGGTDDDGQPRIVRTSLVRRTVDVTVPLVSSGGDPPDRAPERSYLSWLAGADADSLRTETGPDHDDTLLYLMARHGILTAYADVARRMRRSEGLADPGEGVDVAFVDADADVQAPTVTLGRCLDLPVPSLGEGPIGQRIQGLGADDHPEAAELDELRASLASLADVAPADLEPAVAETLDTCAHRLDAWVTAVADGRLARMRRHRPQGVHVGGYGWVEDLRPGPRPTYTDPADGDPTDTPLAVDDDNAGFVHAPSLTHAATAAVLRSGHLSHPGEGAAPFGIDLSSQRVRLARTLAEGVRGGRPLTALLGERFEQGLHERGCADLIEAFRILAPLSDLYEILHEQADLADTIAALGRSLDAARRRLGDARERVRDAEAALADLEARNETVDDDIAEAEAQIPVREDELAAAQDEVDRAQAKIDFYLEHPELHPTPDMWEERDEAIAERDRAQRALNRANRRVDDLRTDKRELPGRIRDAEDDVESAEEVVDRFSRDVRSGESRLREAHRRRDELERRYNAALQERRDRFLYPPTADIDPQASIAATDVADGLELLRLHQGGGIPWGRRLGDHATLPSPGDDAAEEAAAELERLVQAVDAVGDLYLAEGVHQVVLGDPQRAAAALDVAGRGDTPPSEPDVTRTPRTGVEATHRVLVLLDGRAAGAPGWPHDRRSARTLAAPQLEAWAGRLLGDPAAAACRCDYRHPDTGETLASSRLTVADLAVSPLDVVLGGQERGQLSAELERRFAWRALHERPDAVPADAIVHVDAGAGASDPDAPDAGSLVELLEVARALAETVNSAPPADATAVAAPGRAAESGIDVGELARRADGVVALLRDRHDAARAALDGDSDVETLWEALTGLADSGVPDAMPRLPSGDERAVRDVLRDRCRAAAAEAGRRLEEADRVATDGDDGSRAWEGHRDRIRAVLGHGFPVLPRFEPADAGPLAQTLAASEALQDGDPTAAATWLAGAARVREGLVGLATLLLYAESRGVGDAALRVGQLPHAPEDRWVALPAAQGHPLRDGRVGLVVHAAAGLDVSGPLAGFVVDDWREVVPHATETTGVAFNVDDPGPRAAHAVLLGVPPDERPRWDPETVEATVLDALDLAKLRGVDPDALARVDDVGLFLPAVYLAVNTAEATVSTDPARVTRVTPD